MKDSVKDTYDSFALSYDDFNRGYMYERWTGRLLEKAEEAGLRGDRLLDIGCGTGFSFIPMLDRGWQVTACDISPQMLALARAKAGDRAELLVADMRELPIMGEFDLIWAINDPMNYLLSADELQVTLEAIGRNLDSEGIVLFDANTLATYRNFFSNEIVREEEGRRLVWRGQMSSQEIAPNSISEARFEAVGEVGSAHVHRQRHFPKHEVLDAIGAAGLSCIGVFGESEGDLHTELDEEHHTKAVYLVQAAK